MLDMSGEPLRDWRYEIPRYRIIRTTRPANPSRVRFDAPISVQADSDMWQFGEREYQQDETIETKLWPNPSTMFPLNESARRTLEFFNSAMRSRLTQAPWRNGRIDLDAGLSGPCQPSFTLGKPEGRAA